MATRRTSREPGGDDRLAEQAIVDALAPAIDTLIEDTAYFFRRGFSRRGGSRARVRARADGYHHALVVDLRTFFNLVDVPTLFERLRALYPHEPAVEVLEAWVRPLGHRRGLPPGSPVSTLLAHLCLDTIDEALRIRGLRLMRSGDGFIVLVRDLASGLSSGAAA